MAKKTKKNYVNNAELRQELIHLEQTDEFSDKLHLMFWEMCNRIASKPRFFSYTWKEDMITAAYLRCVRYAKSFDTNRTNPFGYFTTTIHNCFFKYRETEMKYQDSKWIELSNHVTEMQHKHRIDLELTEDIKSKMNSANTK